MYAILAHGGHQYRVTAGDRLLVDRLEAEVGSTVTLEPVLLTGGEDGTSTGDAVAGVRVAAVVVSHVRGPKLRVFKYKAKKRYRRVQGHRSDLTEVRIESILGAGQAASAGEAAPRKPRAARAPKAEVAAASVTEEPPAASVTTTEEAAAAPKRAGRRSPARKTAEESSDGA